MWREANQEIMKREDLIQLGFEELPHMTVMNSLVYYIRRKYGKVRIISIGCLGTPNELLTIGELSRDGKTYEDMTVLSNYDYDGYLTVDRIISLLYALDVDFKMNKC